MSFEKKAKNVTKISNIKDLGNHPIRLKKKLSACQLCGQIGVYTLKSMLCPSCYWKWYDQKEGRGVTRIHELRKNDPARAMLYLFRSKAKVWKLDFDLDLEWLSERLAQGRCEVTGLAFAPSNTGTLKKHYRSPLVASVDRIDPKKGYTKENCRRVVWMLNLLKNSYSDAEVLDLSVALVIRTAENHNRKVLAQALEKFSARLVEDRALSNQEKGRGAA